MARSLRQFERLSHPELPPDKPLIPAIRAELWATREIKKNQAASLASVRNKSGERLLTMASLIGATSRCVPRQPWPLQPYAAL